MIRNSDVRSQFDAGTIPTGKDDIESDVEVMLPKCQIQQDLDDVYYCLWQGSGGFGDPIDCDPEKIAQDMREEYVSEDQARNTYGIVLDDGTIDETATEKRRETIRQRRLTGDKWGEGE